MNMATAAKVTADILGCKRLSCPRVILCSERCLDLLGVPSDMTATDVKALFSLPDDDDSMHAHKQRAYTAANGEDLPAGSSGTTIVNDGRPT